MTDRAMEVRKKLFRVDWRDWQWGQSDDLGLEAMKSDRVLDFLHSARRAKPGGRSGPFLGAKALGTAPRRLLEQQPLVSQLQKPPHHHQQRAPAEGLITLLIFLC